MAPEAASGSSRGATHAELELRKGDEQTRTRVTLLIVRGYRMAGCRPTPTEGPPQLSIDGSVATLRLRRPSRRNSLTDDDLRALLDAIAQVDADAVVRVLVLCADTQGQHTPVFSAGYDLGALHGDGGGPQLFERVPDALEAARPITVCALSGSVFGGATDLVLACDLRIALAASVLRMPACALGLHFYPSGMRRYVSRLGVDLAKRAFLTAQPLPVELLAERGLFERVVPRGDFDVALQGLVQQVATLSPLAAQATKRSLNEIAAGRFDEPGLRERERLTHSSAEFAESRAAFAARRTARFEGR